MPVSLSIIIPIYNAAATIERCLNSLKKIQSDHREFVEIVLIDDGSTDDRSGLIDKKITSLSEFKIIRLQQQNSGVSAARNAGLWQATGEWILFLDADDELHCDPLSNIHEAADATAINFPVIRQWEQGTQRLVPPSVISRDCFLEVFTACNPIVICSLVFRRDAIKVEFDEQVAYLEDWQFWLDNPAIFQHVISAEGAALAVVHIHGSNRTAQYNKTGLCRSLIAYRKLKQYEGLLNHKGKSNLLIQAAIGDVQAGKGTSVANFLRLPCSSRLYLRFVAYFLLRNIANYLAPY